MLFTYRSWGSHSWLPPAFQPAQAGAGPKPGGRLESLTPQRLNAK